MNWGPFKFQEEREHRGSLRRYYWQRGEDKWARMYNIDGVDHSIVKVGQSYWITPTFEIDQHRIDDIGPFPSLKAAATSLLLLADAEP